MRRFRGFLDLAFDAVEETTKLVARTHQGVADRTVRRILPNEAGRRIAMIEGTIAERTFQAIRSVNGVARQAVLHASSRTGPFPALATPVRSTASGTVSWYLDHLESTINGVVGAWLHQKGSVVDLGMSIRHDGHRLPVDRIHLAKAYPGTSSRVCVFVHGLSATEWLWSHSAAGHYGDADVTVGTRLEADLGFTPVYIRYNSGRRVAENGRLLSDMLEQLYHDFPVPITEMALVGHSMGGLVARSAAREGREQDASWVSRLRHVVCIGSPHHGSPHARAVGLMSNLLLKIDTAATQVIAELLEARSEGIRDLEQGAITDEEGVVPLVEGVGYYYVASTATRDPMHPVGWLLGDLLVRLSSATGEGDHPACRIPFHSGATFFGLNHFEITNHPEVYSAIRDRIAGASPSF